MRPPRPIASFARLYFLTSRQHEPTGSLRAGYALRALAGLRWV